MEETMIDTLKVDDERHLRPPLARGPEIPKAS